MAGRINSRGASKAPWQGAAGLTLILGDGAVYSRTGSFLAADREIDAKTGTIRISARFPNPEHTLRPGQYGRVRAETKRTNRRPARAAARGQRAAGHRFSFAWSDLTAR